MTIINLSSTRSGDVNGKPWQPSMTEKDAARNGIHKKLYLALVAFALMVVNDHQRMGTPRAQWEPQSTQVDHFTAPYVEAGESELISSLDTEVDPVLDDAHALIEAARAQLDELESNSLPMSTPESGLNLSAVAATHLVEKHDAKVEEDAARGVPVHKRAHRALKWLGAKAPWIEALGMLAFVTLILNVSLWRPQDDILGWTFALAVVLVTIAGQVFLLHPGAEAHNHMREHEAAGNRHEAAGSRARRNRFLVAAALATAVITGAMIYRGLAALGDAELHVTIIMVALAALTGILMPSIAFLAIALDGSTVSRERDALAVALDEDLDADLTSRSQVKQDLDEVAELRDSLNKRTLPNICSAVQETVDQAYYPYNAARMLIGGLAADPPGKIPMILDPETGTGRIGLGIRGARAVELAPLIDRCRRLHSLEAERRQLTERLESVPAHPWARHRR